MHKPDLIHQHKTYKQDTHKALEKAKYSEGHEGMNTAGGLLVSFAGVWGKLWSHTWEGRGVWKAINSTLGPACFGTLGIHPCTEPRQYLPLALSQQQEQDRQNLGIWCRQVRRAAMVPLQTAPSVLQGRR